MAVDIPPKQTVEMDKFRSQVDEFVANVSSGAARVVLENRGTPVAVIVSPDDFARLSQLDDRAIDVQRAFDAMSAPFSDVPAEEVEREAERAVAEARGKRRAEREYHSLA